MRKLRHRDLWKTKRVKDHPCWKCGVLINGRTMVDCWDTGERTGPVPQPMRITICSTCYALAIIPQEDGIGRELTAEELGELKADPETWAQIQHIRGASTPKIGGFLLICALCFWASYFGLMVYQHIRDARREESLEEFARKVWLSHELMYQQELIINESKKP